MKLRCLIGICLTVLPLSGCGVSVIPQATGNNVIDLRQASSSATASNLTISVRVQDLEVAPARLTNNLTSFYVVITNHGNTARQVPLSSFVLLDEKGQQYRTLEPSQVQSFTKRDSEYLIPYPYVGYFYLEDREVAAMADPLGSDLPYYTENHPQDILIEALPVQPILPHAQVSGMIYIPVDLYSKAAFELKVYLPESSDPSHPDLVFPFTVKH